MGYGVVSVWEKKYSFAGNSNCRAGTSDFIKKSKYAMLLEEVTGPKS